MNIAVVTGVGPRTGTSFVMQQALVHGLPIFGKKFIEGHTVESFNPLGYWDIDFRDPFKLKDLEGHVCKVWHPLLPLVPTNCTVLLERRDTVAQIESIRRIYHAELQLKANRPLLDNVNPEVIFYYYQTAMKLWLETQDPSNILKVYTEDLDGQIDNIIEFLKKGLTCQHSY